MNLWGNTWITEWLEGLGRLTLLAKESITSLLTFKVAWRDLHLPDLFHRREIPVGRAHHRGVHRDGDGALRPISSFTRSRWTPPPWRW